VQRGNGTLRDNCRIQYSHLWIGIGDVLHGRGAGDDVIGLIEIGRDSGYIIKIQILCGSLVPGDLGIDCLFAPGSISRNGNNTNLLPSLFPR
jgi:hypothetical protein